VSQLKKRPLLDTVGSVREEESKMATSYPEARVLIVMTGGTICMRSSPEGLVPARGFLEAGMKPRPSFNDGSHPG
jgi:lysophospholipase